jgi:hypothetical protein
VANQNFTSIEIKLMKVKAKPSLVEVTEDPIKVDENMQV